MIRTLEEVPESATHWSKRDLAKRVGISPTSVHRIWRAFGPHPSQIQALEQTAPVLAMIPGTPERRSFDYDRHGTIDLFAALNTATGKVIGKLSAQLRPAKRTFPELVLRSSSNTGYHGWRPPWC